MKPEPTDSWKPRLEELLFEARTRPLDAAELTELNAILRHSGAAREHAAQSLMDDVLLVEHLRESAVEGICRGEPEAVPLPPRQARWRFWPVWRPATAAAVGIVLGLGTASLLWAMAENRKVVRTITVVGLHNGGFEREAGPLSRLFPRALGVWSGDAARVTADQPGRAREGRRSLEFLRAELDAPSQRAPVSCDVFQVVDLRSLRSQTGDRGLAMLELTASFLNGDKTPGQIARFACQVYLFEDNPLTHPGIWPPTLRETLSSGIEYLDVATGDDRWHPISASCILSPKAQFAVVQVSAALRQPGQVELGRHYVDDVRLCLKTMPSLPVLAVMSDK